MKRLLNDALATIRTALDESEYIKKPNGGYTKKVKPGEGYAVCPHCGSEDTVPSSHKRGEVYCHGCDKRFDLK